MKTVSRKLRSTYEKDNAEIKNKNEGPHRPQPTAHSPHTYLRFFFVRFFSGMLLLLHPTASSYIAPILQQHALANDSAGGHLPFSTFVQRHLQLRDVITTSNTSSVSHSGRKFTNQHVALNLALGDIVSALSHANGNCLPQTKQIIALSDNLAANRRG